MTIRVNVDGTFSVDTVEEALELRRRILAASEQVSAATSSLPAADAKVPGSASKGSEQADVSTAWVTFMRSISGRATKFVNQRRVLSYYKQLQGGASVPELNEALNLKNGKEAGGYVSGLRRRAQTAGLDPDDILTRDSEGKFHAGSLLLSAQEIKV